jgi:heat shock protein HtpX
MVVGGKHMKKRIGPDIGLGVRMFMTMFLLALLYAVFIYILLRLDVSVLVIGLVAAGLLLLQYFYSDQLILMSVGAREVSEQEYPELHAIVERLAQMVNIPKPKVAIIDTPVPNALATGRNPKHAVVAVTRGILQILDSRELEAVIAHELSHVLHRDTRVMTMASFFATIASFITQWGMWFGIGFDERDRRDGNGFAIVLLVSVLVWLISFVLIRTLSRYREYAADRGSAIITGEPMALASALIKVSGRMQRIPDADLRNLQGASALMIFPAISRDSIMELFSTHPSLEHRIRKLEQIARELTK